MRVLVVGATGMLGAPVARRLLADGHDVRVLARDPARARALLGDGFEFVAGDVTVPGSLPPAFAGCDAVHVNLRGTNTIESYERVEAGGAANVARAAAAAGVRRIAYVGNAGDPERLVRFPVGHAKLTAARAVMESGVPWTLLKPTHFMESLPLFVRDGRAAIIGRQPHRYHYLAAADFARMAARALVMPECADKELTIFGPEAFTMREALAIYCAAVHPQLRLSTVPLPVFRLLAALRNDQDMRFAAMLFAGFARVGESGDPEEANRLVGAPGTRLAEWCRERAAARGACA